MTPFIDIHGLEYVYDLGDGQRVTALQDIDLSIERGEFIAVIGPNGSGKSTLAYHLNGLLLPSAGQVRVQGMLTSDPRKKWAVRQQVALVFQNPDNQFVASTVEEDVAFGPENQACPPAEIRRRVDKALCTVGMEGYATFPPQMLSGGQKQLVAIAGALATQPACMVFDEPTSMLDPQGRRRILETIRQLNVEQGLTVILITQSMDEASTAQRVIVMGDGRIAMDGPPQKVFEKKGSLEALDLESPITVQIAHRLRDLGMELAPGLLTVDALARALC